MSTVEPRSRAEQTVSLEDVRAFRGAAIANGYPLIRVRSSSKAPLAREWQRGEDPEVLLDVRPEALNTGLVLAGLRSVDLDVDDPQLVSQLMEQADLHLPAGALTRRRANSPRVAIFYRAAEGQPDKRVIKGPNGKIEILGAGQQAVVHGLHPSGAPLTWLDGRGPDSVKMTDLPAVSEEEIDAFLSACKPLLGTTSSDAGPASATSPASRFLDPGFPLPAVLSPSLASVKNEAAAGIEPSDWFSGLRPQQMRAVVQACLDTLDNSTIDPRDPWVRGLFAVADAGRLGCPDARQLALEWSQRGASWTSEADFDTAWESYKPKPGGVTIGSLLALARKAGLDLSQWRDPALARLNAAVDAAHGAAGIRSELMTTSSQRALAIAALPSVPPKRQWPQHRRQSPFNGAATLSPNSVRTDPPGQPQRPGSTSPCLGHPRPCSDHQIRSPRITHRRVVL
jgi:hypothetical protein